MTMFLPNGVDTQKTLNFNMVETTYSPVKYMGSHFWSTTEILIKNLHNSKSYQILELLFIKRVSI